MITMTLPLAQAQVELSQIVARVHEQRERVTLTRNGEDVAVLISADDLEGLEATIEILSDPEALADFRQARAELARGEFVTAEELTATMAARYLRATA